MSGRRPAFPRRRRLTTGKDYQRVFAQPARSSDAYYTVLARANALDGPRLGLAIAKRHVRRAVDRNRLKRLARESFRHHQHELAALDYVVMAKGPAIQADTALLLRSLRRHWFHLLQRCEPSWSPSSSSTAT